MSNPFSKLNKNDFSVAGKSFGEGKLHGKKTQENIDEDSELFLKTVGRTLDNKKLGKDKKQAENRSFAEAMEASGIKSLSGKKDKKNKKTPKKAAQKDPDQKTIGIKSEGENNFTAKDSSDKESSDKDSKAKDISEGKAAESLNNSEHLNELIDKLPEESLSEGAINLGIELADSSGRRFLKPTEGGGANPFLKAMSGVEPLSKKGRDIIKSQKDKKKRSHPSGKSPSQIMREIIDGRIEFSLNLTNEYMEGQVRGLDPDIMHKLRNGLLSPEAHIDLHGMVAAQAYDELLLFIKSSYQRNLRTVIAITGKGKNSPTGVPVIRNLIQGWLTREPMKRVVLAFCTSQPHDGGAGALYILLRRYKKSIGKVQWELPYSSSDMD